MKKLLIVALLFLSIACQNSYHGFSKGDKVKIYWESNQSYSGKVYVIGQITDIDSESLVVKSLKKKKDYIIHKSKIISIDQFNN